MASPSRPFYYKHINDHDDVAAGVQWVLKGRVDTEGFAKHFPRTSQDLQEGKVSPEQVGNDLKSVCYGEKNHIVHLALLATESGLPTKLFSSIPEEERYRILYQFSEELSNCLAMKGNSRGTEAILKECFDKQCEEWAERLDRKLFRGKSGTFLKKCPLYDVSLEKYWEPYMPMDIVKRLQDNDKYSYSEDQKHLSDYRINTIFLVLKNIASGKHDSSKTCWQCGKRSGDMKVCGKCSIAQYCSRKCQITAWKEGHKEKCEVLKSKYAAFRKSLQAIDNAHSPGSQIANEVGIPLSDELDYRLLPMLTHMDVPWESSQYGDSLGEPCMEVFYENLRRVVRREFWFYEDADMEAYRKANIPKEDEMMFMIKLCYFLCFDYFAHSSETKFDENVMIGLTYDGIRMPVERYLSLYQAGMKTEDSTERRRLRREERNIVIHDFMENFRR